VVGLVVAVRVGPVVQQQDKQTQVVVVVEECHLTKTLAALEQVAVAAKV